MILIQGGADVRRGHRGPRKRAAASNDATAIAEIAAGIAHDMNNRLSVILGQTQLMRRIGNLDPLLDRKLEKIEQETLRASTMTRGLLDRARREPEHEPVAINALVGQALDQVQTTMRQERITLEMALCEPAPIVVGDAEQLTKALVHLMRNAVDAMPESGTLTVTTDITDESVEISVSDTGAGMAPEQVSRIFEPFYTTKGDGCGAGIGLFLTSHILKGHGGAVAVASAPGRGTTMTVRLPRAIAPAPRLAVVR